MGDTVIQLRVEAPLALVQFSRPPANAYDLAFLKQLDAAIEEIRLRDDVKVVVLQGNPKFFSAGADITTFLGATPEAIMEFALFGHLTLVKLESLPKIVIAAIEGHAVGGGLEIALACDLRFMARGSGRLGLGEVKIAAVPNMGGTQRLPRLIGKARALKMLIAGDTVDGEEALRIGLVDDLHAPEELLGKTVEYATSLARGPVLTIGLIKQCVNEGLEMPLAGGLALERACGGVAFRSEDFKEGSRAFAEKRPPVFRGR